MASIVLCGFNVLQCNIKAMSKNERLKAQIDFLKTIVVLLLTAIFAMAGWLVTIRKTAELFDVLLVGTATLALSVVVFLLVRISIKCLKDLENLKERR